MTGLDSNVLVRYFVKDDPAQTPIAVRVIRDRTAADPGWISIAVLVELLWVLTRTYKQKQASIIQIIESLLASDEIVIQQDEMVRKALDPYRNGRADFADCLISLVAQNAGCDRTVTFDRVAARDAGMELLG
ncbi:MAG: type II toxin-antitoxin system VapC family toxin [Terracidiphilus sp.]